MTGIKSKIYGILTAVIILGYIFFLSSSCIFHTQKNLVYTPINSSAKLSENVSVTLKQWDYSPNDKLMTAMFSVSNSSLEDAVFNWRVQERHTTKLLCLETGQEISLLKAEVDYPFTNMIVVTIYNVPPGFEEIALSLQLANTKEEQSSKEKENSIVSFFTNKEKVKKVESLKKFSADEYRIEYLNMQIESKNAEIEKLEKQNEKLLSDNETYQKDIEALIENQKYETTDEIKASLDRIKNYERQIANNKDTVEKNKYTISEIRKSISDIENTIAKLKEKEE